MTDPADESGYCLSTLHDFGATTITNGAGLAESPDGSTLYYVNGATIKTIDLATFSIGTLGTIASAAHGLAIDASGNVYAIASSAGTISKVTAGGSVTNGWAAPPASWKFRGFFGLTMGRDGNLYALAQWIGHDPSWTVFKITLAGTVTQLTALDSALAASVGYDGVAVDSAGNVWVILDPPPSGANLHVNNTLRRYRPGPPDVTDIAIQPLVSYSDDGDTEAYGGLYCDADDRLLAPMVTFKTVIGSRDLSWFLRVADDGTATRIAGSWLDADRTASNVADGPLGTSLACEADSAAGTSQNGRTLYFIDHTDLGGGGTNLLRTLALCAGHGVIVGMVGVG